MANTRIRDIAERLGVSVATVSRSLNDKPGVGDEVRRRVLDLAAELSFAPNSAARGLSTARTQTIGFVMHRNPWQARRDSFYLLMMHGAEEEVAKSGYHVILSSIDATSGAGAAGDIRSVREGRVDGLILAGPDIDPRLILALHQSGMPLVLIDNALRQTPLDVVVNNDRGSAFAAVTHLIEHGHARIAFIGGPLTWLSTGERRAGYEEALAAANLSELNTLHEAQTTVETGHAVALTLLANPPLPTAIFAVNDSMAIGAMRALHHAGLRVPQDVAIIGVDDIEAAQYTTPPLTTVRIFKERIGAIAARQLLDRLEQPRTPPLRTYVGAELVTRQSCGCNALIIREEVGTKAHQSEQSERSIHV